jgi:hypothetical protein
LVFLFCLLIAALDNLNIFPDLNASSVKCAPHFRQMVEATALGNKAPTAVSAMTRARLLRNAESLGADSDRVRDMSRRCSICCC